MKERSPYRVSRKVDMYTCKICSKTFQNSTELVHHIKVDEGRSFCEKCEQCDKVFFVPSTYKYHLQAKHKVPLNLPECEVCGKCFQDNYNLNRHMVVHTGERPFHCSNCFKAFKSKDNAKNHLRFCKNQENVQHEWYRKFRNSSMFDADHLFYFVQSNKLLDDVLKNCSLYMRFWFFI